MPNTYISSSLFEYRTYYIYKITNNINGKRYMGQKTCPVGIPLDKDQYKGSGILIGNAKKERQAARNMSPEKREAWRRHLSEAYVGIHVSDETRSRISAAKRWKSWSAETRRRLTEFYASRKI